MGRRRSRRKGRSDVTGGRCSAACLSSASSSVVDVLPAVKHIFLFLVWFFATFIFVQKKKKRVLPRCHGGFLVLWLQYRLWPHTQAEVVLLSWWGRCFTFFPEHSLHFLFFCCVYVICPHLFLKLAFPESPVSALQALIGWGLC